MRLPMPVWHGIGNDFQGSYELPVVVGEHRFRFTGKPTVGIVFIERTESLDMRRVARYDYVVVGSTWTEQRLRQLLAVHNSHVVDREEQQAATATEVVRAMQGVDAQVWPWRGRHPPVEVLFQKHFVVFSGGKLEYRKGQDIAVAAFRQFRQTIAPEALLVTAWHSQYPELMHGLADRGLVSAQLPPDTSPAALDAWLLRSGLPVHSFRNLPPLRAPPAPVRSVPLLPSLCALLPHSFPSAFAGRAVSTPRPRCAERRAARTDRTGSKTYEISYSLLAVSSAPWSWTPSVHRSIPASTHVARGAPKQPTELSKPVWAGGGGVRSGDGAGTRAA